jgi:predicted membrane channel-forming protein YqfA (hemolysin III family)
MMLLAMCWLQLPIKTQELMALTGTCLALLLGSLGESRRLAMMLLATMYWLQLPIMTQLMALTGTCLAFLLVALANLGDWQ